MKKDNFDKMTYELAKKLKEAGFSQNIPLNKEWAMATGYFIEPEDVKIPTLSELIEACIKNIPQDHWFELHYFKDWEATISTATNPPRIGQGLLLAKGEGLTPQEAVANLWLKLKERKVF